MFFTIWIYKFWFKWIVVPFSNDKIAHNVNIASPITTHHSVVDTTCPLCSHCSYSNLDWITKQHETIFNYPFRERNFLIKSNISLPFSIFASSTENYDFMYKLSVRAIVRFRPFVVAPCWLRPTNQPFIVHLVFGFGINLIIVSSGDVFYCINTFWSHTTVDRASHTTHKKLMGCDGWMDAGGCNKLQLHLDAVTTAPTLFGV